eukprot:3342110-Amphidinium_carterae.2
MKALPCICCVGHVQSLIVACEEFRQVMSDKGISTCGGPPRRAAKSALHTLAKLLCTRAMARLASMDLDTTDVETLFRLIDGARDAQTWSK